jgi:hypothetical protein
MLHSWDNYFILAGGAAATLMGLLFVAVTVGGTGFSTSLIKQGTRGFLTPTLVQFGTVLMQALAMLVPWPSPWPIGIMFGLGGLFGLAYQIHVVVRRHHFGLTLPDWHDWVPYVVVPALGSGCLVVGAVGLIAEKSFAPFVVAGATALLLFAGVYGAWDLTLWIIKNRDKSEQPDDSPIRVESAPQREST